MKGTRKKKAPTKKADPLGMGIRRMMHTYGCPTPYLNQAAPCPNCGAPPAPAP